MVRGATDPPRLSASTTLALIRWAALVAGLLLVGFGLACSLSRQWQTGLPLVVLGGALLSLPLQRRRRLASAQAAQQWSPSQVHEVLAAKKALDAPRVEQVRVLRRLDRKLGLGDAVELVNRAAPAESSEH